MNKIILWNSEFKNSNEYLNEKYLINKFKKYKIIDIYKKNENDENKNFTLLCNKIKNINQLYFLYFNQGYRYSVYCHNKIKFKYINKFPTILITKYTNKFNILNYLLNCKKFLLKTYKLNKIYYNNHKVYYDNKEIFKNNNIIIARPQFGFKGENIIVLDNKNKINQLKSNYNYILTKYITNPLLFNDLKFHIRIYIGFKITNNNIYHSTFDYCKILTAKQKYKNEDFNNKNIHDTHIKSTKNDYYLNLNNHNHINLDKINLQIDLLINKLKEFEKYFSNDITKLLKDNKNIFNFNFAENYFDVFGCDIMFDNKYNLYFIEANLKIGFGFKNKNIREIISQKYFDWIYNLMKMK